MVTSTSHVFISDSATLWAYSVHALPETLFLLIASKRIHIEAPRNPISKPNAALWARGGEQLWGRCLAEDGRAAEPPEREQEILS